MKLEESLRKVMGVNNRIICLWWFKIYVLSQVDSSIDQVQYFAYMRPRFNLWYHIVSWAPSEVTLLLQSGSNLGVAPKYLCVCACIENIHIFYIHLERIIKLGFSDVTGDLDSFCLFVLPSLAFDSCYYVLVLWSKVGFLPLGMMLTFWF